MYKYQNAAHLLEAIGQASQHGVVNKSVASLSLPSSLP
jgi:hypothetical protein